MGNDAVTRVRSDGTPLGLGPNYIIPHGHIDPVGVGSQSLRDGISRRWAAVQEPRPVIAHPQRLPSGARKMAMLQPNTSSGWARAGPRPVFTAGGMPRIATLQRRRRRPPQSVETRERKIQFFACACGWLRGVPLGEIIRFGPRARPSPDRPELPVCSKTRSQDRPWRGRSPWSVRFADRRDAAHNCHRPGSPRALPPEGK